MTAARNGGRRDWENELEKLWKGEGENVKQYFNKWVAYEITIVALYTFTLRALSNKLQR